METPLSFSTQLARQTGHLLLTFFRKAGLNTSVKADKSVVTEADLEADRLIAQAIQERYPEDLLLSEELRPTYSENPGQRGVWIVDPLDGTTNFSLGLHFWGVSIARLVQGRPETAVLYFPAVDELYTAQLGAGAALNGEAIQVRPPVPNYPAAFFSCCSRTYRNYRVSVPYKARILGSAAYSFCAAARGMALLSFEATAKIWDIAAAWLLVSEAGGTIGPLDGPHPFPIQPGLDYARQSFPTLAAATTELAAKARKQIQPR